MAETRLSGGNAPVGKRQRVRAGRNLKERHNFIGFHGHGLLALIFFAIVALSVLGVGLGIASLTIFSVGNSPKPSRALVEISPSASPSAANALVGRPIDGTIVGIWADQNLIAIQPAGQQPVQATITSKTAITRGGASAALSDLIPGDAVIVSFSQGPQGTLLVVTLQDIETVPTNTPSAPLTPVPSPTATPPPNSSPEPTPTPAGGQ